MPAREGTVLADFRGPDAAAAVAAWAAVDDRVMGGVSASGFAGADGHATFAGTVSAENGGGFASVRAALDARPPADASHVWIEARGAPATYYLNLRTDGAFDGISYRADFRPTRAWSRLELPLADFRPTFRGRDVPGAPALAPEAIRQLGLMIADGQLGPFALDVRAIGTLSG